MIVNQAAGLLAQTEHTAEVVLPPSYGESAPKATAFRFEALGCANSTRQAGAATEQIELRVELGRAQLRSGDASRLRSGSVVALDKLAGEPVDLYVGTRRIARGELLVLDGKVAVRVVETARY